MPNNLGVVIDKFTKRLDAVIESETKTSGLNANKDLVGEMDSAGKVEVAKIVLDGLADHVRSGGFTAGSITQTWEPFQLRFDRDREFSIDVLDDEERAMIVSANVMNEFLRTKVVPEVDAVRFSTLFAKKANGNTAAANLATGDAAVDALLDAEAVIEDNGGELSNCILYMTSTVKKLLRKAQPWRFGVGDNPNTLINTYDDMRIETVPQNRFYTAIDLLDGTTTGETGGGYVKDANAKDINFMIVQPDCCAAIAKHVKLRYFAPDVNQTDDAHLWQYRLFHDLLVYDNKAGLIYAHTKA